MRVAVIADIHSNYPALEAVIADIDTQDVDDILVAGDAINSGPSPRAVLDLIYDRNLRMVIGNHEHEVLETLNADTELWPEWGTSFWTASQLSQDDIPFLQKLPTSLVIDDMAVFHASPTDLETGIFPDSPPEFLQDLFGGVEQSVIITAHTHLPFVLCWEDRVVVNPGSVGMSHDGNPMPSYVILTWHKDRLHIQHRRVNYDYDKLIQQFETSGLFDTPQRYFARVFQKQMLTGMVYIKPFAHQVLDLKAQGLTLMEAQSMIDLDTVPPRVDNDRC